VRIAEDKVFVTGLKGPLEEDWEKKVEAFVAQIPSRDRPAACPSGSETWREESR